ncbi:ubiquitin-like-conjugating enzyme ATG10 [Chanos chanos]|uniref:Ubiquitin-like-conjugating enzyme ATG10 n=1 Tax=Chanos chanos TaxID=29144 RepID=A0A6J2UTZ4_CHACN|nr:ubiquitin-like-conjugating enzyme ATG10 [Chanos chanos]XP_030623224.1 ubiquitin-like-conjugating enzyme ATG10 [Chanos chanos]
MCDYPEAGCYLDETTFQRCCQLFLQHSSSLTDGWSWETVKGSEEGFMKHTSLVCVKESGRNRTTDDTSSLTGQGEEDDEDEDDVGARWVPEDPAVVRYEYHVLYSCSYQVPVLYFRASTLDGRVLSLEEVWEAVHPNYRVKLQQGPWDILTQQEHPILGQPFFMLHPCHTEHFMRPVLEMARTNLRRVNYVVTWLSAVGPVVGLELPLSYCTAVSGPE